MGYSLYRHISPSGRVYVGITKQKPEYRWNHGKGYCRGDQPAFERAIIKYGWDNITHEVLLTNLSADKAKEYEILLIAFYKSIDRSYNISLGGDGALGGKSHLGQKASEETRRKMSIAHKGKCVGNKNAMYGRHETAPAYGKFGRKHPASKSVYQYDKDGNFIKKWDCLSDVQRELGLIVTNITAVCRGKGFTLGGFRWSYTYPYIFNPEEDARRSAKRRKLSAIAKEGFVTGRRKRMCGDDNPMSKRNVLKRSSKKINIELKKIEAQKQIVKSRGTSSSSTKK